MSTFEKVRKIVADQLSIDASNVTESTTFEEVDADSLDVVEVIMSVESEFGIDLPDEEVEHFKNVGELSGYVNSLLK